jgi:hypothetical protein
MIKQGDKIRNARIMVFLKTGAETMDKFCKLTVIVPLPLPKN